MRLPSNIATFPHQTALLVVSGELEANLYIIAQNSLLLKGSVLIIPTKETVQFKKNPPPQIASWTQTFQVSKAFETQVAQEIQILSQTFPVSKIYIFAPQYTAFRIFQALSLTSKELVEDMFFGEFIKMHPFGVLQNIMREKRQI